jgi:hypothetical protein
MTGSPIILFDGNDPFMREGLEPSVSCRLYAHEDGHVDGAPSVDALRRALDERGGTPNGSTLLTRGVRTGEALVRTVAGEHLA